MPDSLDVHAWDCYKENIISHQIDNFGSVGTRLLLDWMGVVRVTDAFYETAMHRIPRLGRMTSIIRSAPMVLYGSKLELSALWNIILSLQL